MKDEPMRMRTALIAVALVGALSGVLVGACADTADDCRLNNTCCPDGTLACFTNVHDGGHPACSGDPSAKNTTDECGVFVHASAMVGGDGTKAKPFAKLAEAITQAESAGKRVYACTSVSAAFSESVSVNAGIEIYGGFDCVNGWAWSQDARSLLSGIPDKVALTIEKSAGGAKIAGFQITAASPSDMKGGGSSIAVVADDVKATLDHCDVAASDAADGADGQTPTMPATKGADAPPPDPVTMSACINSAAVMGGAPGMTTCDDGTTSGGAGGKGGITGTNSGDGQNGADGQPSDATKGKGGSGADAMNDCNDGTKGKSGDAGGAGPGGSAAGDVFSLTGVTNTDMTDGKPGTKAQGGGGGGGAKSGMFCMAGAMTVDGPGASGGGAGAGGCGGKGGGGGKAGGSSIAIVNLGTRMMLTEVTMAVGKAGSGGKGAAGQSGGAPGHGADGGTASGTSPSKPGCKGGDGGLGGDGGPSGGGRGGHSIGFAFAKTPSAAPMTKSFTPGTPGSGGTAGIGAPMSSNGSTGIAAPCWNFAANAACK